MVILRRCRLDILLRRLVRSNSCSASNTSGYSRIILCAVFKNLLEGIFNLAFNNTNVGDVVHDNADDRSINHIRVAMETRYFGAGHNCGGGCPLIAVLKNVVNE